MFSVCMISVKSFCLHFRLCICRLYSPANGASPWNSSTQSVELDNETELSEPLDADAGDLFKSNLPEHLLYSYCVFMPLYHTQPNGDAFNLNNKRIFIRRDLNKTDFE
jgi:hypothetical protein